jgi:hypothetical protein
MSALGQKRTDAVQKAMSALPSIATAKADMVPKPVGTIIKSYFFKWKDVRFAPKNGHVQCN